jgi:DNA invertase Pin-like site-specific DNA recombinase
MRRTVGNVSTEDNPEMQILLRIAIAVEKLVEMQEQQPRKRRKPRRETAVLERNSTLRTLREMIVRDPSATQQQLAERFGVNRSTVSRWLGELSKYEEQADVTQGVVVKNSDGSFSIDGVYVPDETDE